jgi:hypothetical protein
VSALHGDRGPDRPGQSNVIRAGSTPPPGQGRGPGCEVLTRWDKPHTYAGFTATSIRKSFMGEGLPVSTSLT